MSYVTSSSPYKSVQGVGSGLRPSDIDLGKGSTSKADEAKIRALMGPRAKVNRFNGHPKVINELNA